MRRFFKEIDYEPLEKYFPGALEVLKLDFLYIPNRPAFLDKMDNFEIIQALCKRYDYKGNPYNLLLISIYLWLSNNDQHSHLQKKERDYIGAVKDFSLFTNNISDSLDIEEITIKSKKFPEIKYNKDTLKIKNKQLLSEIYNAIKPVLEKYENIDLNIPSDKSSGYENYIKNDTKLFFNYIKGTSQMTNDQSIWFIHDQPGNFLGSAEAITKRLGRLLDK